MARRKKTDSDAPEKPARPTIIAYDVRVSRNITVNGIMFRPGSKYRVKPEYRELLGDAATMMQPVYKR